MPGPNNESTDLVALTTEKIPPGQTATQRTNRESYTRGNSTLSYKKEEKKEKILLRVKIPLYKLSKTVQLP